VVTGLGAFIAAAAAQAAGLQVVPLAAELGDAAARCAPAVSVALLLDRELTGAGNGFRQDTSKPAPDAGSADVSPVVDAVVKLGGGVLAHPQHFELVLGAIAAAARRHRLLIVPGGGPFADAVRDADRRLRLDDEAAHWMAVLAMDQFAHLIASRLGCGVLVSDANDIASALGAGRVPILAPYRWLRDTDPLPHSWDVTSDSIAAWIAGALGATRLILVKPPGAAGGDVVDAYFSRALPSTVTVQMVAADNMVALDRAWTR
jgi:aspartokinase-like uncharacterized kinase